ncbi:hypothetical protein GCM10009837_06630 [Streptomyces durmitorensis]|uniref:Uncharacterized protein n=1 Tax=Streptomyces durmitorensis TaxID=319947 RepID=A0ABY4PN10_9ACTN|nr:hypothetical protein [Streptomyces durmitorensis]UQT54441.1 hypothetical protein M4V62_04665 [Streptomyces durmitorensis]
MTTIGIPPRSQGDWDVPADTVAACITLRQAATATHSESDRIAYGLDVQLVTHPEVCSHDEDYPGWAERVARAEAQNAAYRRVVRWNAAHPIGTPVTAYPGSRQGQGIDTATCSEAMVLGGHSAIVIVDGISGGIALSHIDIRTGGAS